MLSLKWTLLSDHFMYIFDARRVINPDLLFYYCVKPWKTPAYVSRLYKKYLITDFLIVKGYLMGLKLGITHINMHIISINIYKHCTTQAKHFNKTSSSCCTEKATESTSVGDRNRSEKKKPSGHFSHSLSLHLECAKVWARLANWHAFVAFL